MITALDASASVTSDSVIAPTPPCSTRTATSSVPSFSSPATIASIEPWTSDLTTTGSSFAPLPASWLNISSTEPRPVAAARLLAPLALAVLGDLARPALAVDHDQRIAGVGHAVQAEDLDRHRRAGRLHGSGRDRRPARAPGPTGRRTR